MNLAPFGVRLRKTVDTSQVNTQDENNMGFSTVPTQPNSFHVSKLIHRATDHVRRRWKEAGLVVLAKLKANDLSTRVDAVSGPSVTGIAPKKLENFEDHYVQIRYLAKGGNGKVFLCRDIHTGAYVAVKTIYKEHHPIPLEGRVLEHLSLHKNIIRYLQVFAHPQDSIKQNMVFEYCSLGDLHDYCIARLGTGVPEPFLWSLLSQISSGLNHLHTHGVVHGDLKPGNIFVTPSPDSPMLPIFKIGDFGTAFIEPSVSVPRGHLGTWEHSTPEAHRFFGPTTDIWALGTIVHVLATGREPIREIKIEEIDCDKWWDKYGPNMTLLEYVPDIRGFREYCFWRASHPLNIVQIDRPNQHLWFRRSVKYSKLLNYFMMRCMDVNYLTRISASTLQRYTATLCDFVLNISLTDHEDALDQFQHEIIQGYGPHKVVSESKVLMQIYIRLWDRAKTEEDPESLKGFLTELPSVMDVADHKEIRRLI
jgi:serine/threonine protein kinase